MLYNTHNVMLEKSDMLCYITHIMLSYKTNDILFYITHDMLHNT